MDCTAIGVLRLAPLAQDDKKQLPVASSQLSEKRTADPSTRSPRRPRWGNKQQWVASCVRDPEEGEGLARLRAEVVMRLVIAFRNGAGTLPNFWAERRSFKAQTRFQRVLPS